MSRTGLMRRVLPTSTSDEISRGLGMGGHQSAATNDEVWLTPPDLLAKLGPFDLDPCAAPEPRPWPTAAAHYTRADGGLRQPWSGRIWLNPPYGPPPVIRPWLERMVQHGRGTALTFARTETDAFHRYVWQSATAALFLRGRLFFCRRDGTRAAHNAGAPSVLVAYGHDDAERLRASGIDGHFVQLGLATAAERVREQGKLFA